MSDQIDWDQKMRDALETLAERPGDRMAELQRIQATLGKQKFAQAAALAQAYLRNVPDDPRAWDMYAATLLYLGHDADAAKASAKAVEHDPEYHIARLNYACSLTRLGQHEEAIDQLTMLLGHRPEMREFVWEDEDLAPLRSLGLLQPLIEATRDESPDDAV